VAEAGAALEAGAGVELEQADKPRTQMEIRKELKND
jgi:hypothetical protein